MNPFEFVGSINESKQDIMEDEKDYNAFLINRALSYFTDTIFYANEMNKNRHLAPRLQYDFLRQGIRKRRRFSKWAKKPKPTPDIELIQEIYGYSIEKAEEALECLTDEEMEVLRNRPRISKL